MAGLLVMVGFMGAMGMRGVKAADLRCEYLVDPLAIAASSPRLSWKIKSDGRDVMQTGYQILVADSPERLADDDGNLWDTGCVESDRTLHIAYAGQSLNSRQRVYWKVRVWTIGEQASPWSKTANWRMGLLAESDWAAKWIGKPDAPPADKPLDALPATMLRKSFDVEGRVKRATLYASALGVYEMRINGQRVGDHILAPEWTDYNSRVQYQTYDVTSLIESGENALGGMLGDGWYAGRLGISHIVEGGPLRGHYGKHPHLLVQLEIELEDGKRLTIASDDTWKSTTDGPIRKACILDGEVYDARKEQPGWDKPGFDDASWKGVHVSRDVGIEVVPQPNEPIRITEELKPVEITEPSPGVYVIDFGQNLAGVWKTSLSGKAGTEIRLRHAEVLEDDGNIYRANLRMEPFKDINPGLGARQEDTYILRGDGEEKYQPRFTYHGFRYVEVVGLSKKPDADFIAARVFHSEAPRTSTFECSSPLLTQIMKNIVWTLRDNLHGVPTDCPQRDERMGWTGDILAFAQTACYLMDMGAFYTKWLQDMRDDQLEDGRFPDFAPMPFEPTKPFSGVPAWGDAGVFVPWTAYLNYGDERILADNFEAARRWVDWIHSNNSELLWEHKRHNDYGDWLNGNTLKLEGFGFPANRAQVPNETLATAFFHESASIVGKMAAVLGKEAEAARYGKLAADIKKAFVKAYIDENGRIKGDTQSGYALALDFELMPNELEEKAAKRMVETVEEYNWHISTGFHTTVKLMNELTRNGRVDVAYRLMNNTTIPSWGYTVEQGGTTIWERWDGYVKGRGYQDPGMNSFNHYAIGAVGEWMFRAILGINPEESAPGYGHIVLRPLPGGGLTWAKGAYDSIRGRIAVDWKIDDADLRLNVTIPANTKATLFVPAGKGEVLEGGKPAGDAEGVSLLREEADSQVYTIGSGTYTFVSTGYRPPPEK